MKKYPSYDIVEKAAREFLNAQSEEFECSTNTLAAELLGKVGDVALDVIYKALQARAGFELFDLNHKAEATKKFRGNPYHPKIWHPSRGEPKARNDSHVTCPQCGFGITLPSPADTK